MSWMRNLVGANVDVGEVLSLEVCKMTPLERCELGLHSDALVPGVNFLSHCLMTGRSVFWAVAKILSRGG